MRALLYADLTTRSFYTTPEGASFSWPALVQGDTATLGFRLREKRDGKIVEARRIVQGVKVAIGRRDARPLSGTIRFQVGNPATTPAEGTNLTTALNYNFTGAELQSALNALSGKPATATVVETEGSFLISWGSLTSHTTITPRSNRLGPISVARLMQYVRDADYITELRLIQAPVAFADAFENVLPPAPQITEILAGGTNGDTTWDEVQKLYIPPTFEGAFILSRGFRKTANGEDDVDGYITPDDTAESIAAKINATLVDPGEVFVVAALEGQNAVTIRFTGDMSGTDHDLLGITVITAPAGDPTSQLKLDRPEMAAVLRGAKNGEIKLPIEVEFSLENEADDAVTDVITIAGEVTIKAEITLDNAAQAQNTDWLREPSPVSYRPRGAGQTANGVLHWSENRGNGVATSFAIDHNLSTDIALPLVRRNVTDGELLVLGVDYSVSYDNNNTLTITALGDWITTPPDTDEWLIAILGMAQASQYASHTHSIAEVDDLQTILDTLSAAIAALEASAAVGSGGTRDPAAGSILLKRTLPVIADAFPMRTSLLAALSAAPASGAAATTGAAVVNTIADIPDSALPRDGDLLGAIHDAALTSLPGTLPTPSSANKGTVWQNRTAAAVAIPGGGGRKSSSLKPGEFLGSDGRRIYRVINPSCDAARVFTAATSDVVTLAQHGFADTQRVRVYSTTTLPAGLSADTDYFVRDATTNTFKLAATSGGAAIDITSTGSGTHYLHTAPLATSYYAADFEAVVDLGHVDSDAFQVGAIAEVKFGFEIGLRNKKTSAPRVSDKTTKAEWRLLVELGTPLAEDSPSTTGSNLKRIVWGATPVLDKTLYFTKDSSGPQTFGIRIKREAAPLETASFTLQKCIYGKWTSSAATLAVADFFIRLRLTQIDFEDIDDAEGFVILLGLDKVIEGDAGNMGTLIVK